MKSFFKDLFEYNHQVNQDLIGVFAQAQDNLPEKIIHRFHHILNAHHIWNQRILLKTPLYGVWEMHPFDDLKIIDRDNYWTSIQIIEACDLGSLIDYKNSQGKPFTNRIQEMCFHIINHSTYHRGQIALELRTVGIEPLATDYIFYKR